MHKKLQNNFNILVFIILFVSLPLSFTLQAFAQSITLEDMITYNLQSNFIKEFQIPLKELGLKGTVVDSQGNAWLYHSTNKTSIIMKLEPETGKFTSYDIEGDTIVDTPIINLAGGQLVSDNTRNVIWFTDARTNSIGKLDIQNGKIELVKIPTPKAGPMGITLSSDGKNIWFTEIIANKIAKLDVDSKRITEYLTGEETGPTLLTFDKEGILWVTQSYSNNILRVQPGLLGTIIASGMSTFTLPKPDTFSPFGIATVDDNGTQKIFVSDHSSSRVISSDVSSNLQSYTSYWTSPSKIYPTTLPGQIVSDKSGNIYFPQHGGNRISKISIESGIMTEYDIPTGPLSTALFIAASDDGKKVWVTEWASNKIAYLDMNIPVPFNLQVKNNQIILDKAGSNILDVMLEAKQISPFISLNQSGLSVIGMTESGLNGITYAAQPQWIDMEKNPVAESQISLKTENNARPGQYTIMVRASAPEEDQLLVSKLYPVSITLNVPEPTTQLQKFEERQDAGVIENISFKDMTKFLAVLAAIGLIGFLIYGRIKKSKKINQ